MIIKRISFIASFFILFSFNVFGQNENLECKKFKTGKYYYPQLPREYGESKRTETKQISYITKPDMTLTWKINWLTDCSYEMILEDIKNNDGIYNIGDRIVAEIISIEDKCYVFEGVLYSSKYPDGKKFPQGTLCKE